MKASYRTFISGVSVILIAIGPAIKALFDSDPSTNPDWNLVVAAITAGVGLMFARDEKVSSAAAGIK